VPESRIVGKAVAIWMHKEPGWNLPSFSRAGSFK
ncbi:MAG: signal peptidase I, partial [Pseudomonadales bacterium]|nr:signal peptidase I [Pseudomonadales bacterium]